MITFATKWRKMTIREWVHSREINGFPTFSFGDVRQEFPAYSEQVIKNELFRLSAQKKLYPAYKGFYVIVSPQYGARSVVPPMYYIDQLMTYLGKPYYISLLSAAALLGSAHQRPQRLSVTTVFPRATVSSEKNRLLLWSYRKHIPSELLETRNSETGTVRYSNAELTAVDIVQYEQYVGGLSRAATVLEELADDLDFGNVAEKLFEHTSVAAVQRLGYILETVLHRQEIADTLHHELVEYAGRFRYVPLTTRNHSAPSERDSRWKIYVNTTIEIDELENS